MFGYFNIVDAQGTQKNPQPLVFAEALSFLRDYPACSLVAVAPIADPQLERISDMFARLDWRFGPSPQEVLAMRTRVPSDVERELNSFRAARQALERWVQRDGKRSRRAVSKAESRLAA